MQHTNTPRSENPTIMPVCSAPFPPPPEGADAPPKNKVCHCTDKLCFVKIADFKTKVGLNKPEVARDIKPVHGTTLLDAYVAAVAKAGVTGVTKILRYANPATNTKTTANNVACGWRLKT